MVVLFTSARSCLYGLVPGFAAKENHSIMQHQHLPMIRGNKNEKMKKIILLSSEAKR